MEHIREINENNFDILGPDIEEFGCRYSAGPLNINRSAKKAGTVMGSELILDDNEFDILDILASREGEYITLDELYKTIWGITENPDGKEIARTTIDELIKKVSQDGYGFMWIDYSPEAGYIFNTHWGYNWNSRNGTSSLEPIIRPTEDEETPVRLIIRQRSRKAEYIAGVGAIAAGIILMLLFLFNSPILNTPDVEPLFLEVEETDVPLAQPNFEDTG